jgi:hypothetical protein
LTSGILSEVLQKMAGCKVSSLDLFLFVYLPSSLAVSYNILMMCIETGRDLQTLFLVFYLQQETKNAEYFLWTACKQYTNMEKLVFKLFANNVCRFIQAVFFQVASP